MFNKENKIKLVFVIKLFLYSIKKTVPKIKK